MRKLDFKHENFQNLESRYEYEGKLTNFLLNSLFPKTFCSIFNYASS